MADGVRRPESRGRITQSVVAPQKSELRYTQNWRRQVERDALAVVDRVFDARGWRQAPSGGLPGNHGNDRVYRKGSKILLVEVKGGSTRLPNRHARRWRFKSERNPRGLRQGDTDYGIHNLRVTMCQSSDAAARTAAREILAGRHAGALTVRGAAVRVHVDSGEALEDQAGPMQSRARRMKIDYGRATRAFRRERQGLGPHLAAARPARSRAQRSR